MNPSKATPVHGPRSLGILVFIDPSQAVNTIVHIGRYHHVLISTEGTAHEGSCMKKNCFILNNNNYLIVAITRHKNIRPRLFGTRMPHNPLPNSGEQYICFPPIKKDGESGRNKNNMFSPYLGEGPSIAHRALPPPPLVPGHVVISTRDLVIHFHPFPLSKLVPVVIGVTKEEEHADQ